MKAVGAILLTALGASQGIAGNYIVKFKRDNTLREVSYQAKRSFDMSAFTTSLMAVPSMPKTKILNVSALASKTMSALGMMQVSLSDRTEAQKLAANSEVAYVEEEFFFDAPKYAPIDKEEEDSEITWGLKAIDAQGAWAQGVKGQGARVLVLDTGIDKNHPDIAANFEEGKSFVHGMPSSTIVGASVGVLGNSLFDAIHDAEEEAKVNDYLYFDDVGHGTHVSGTIAAPKNGFGVAGVAPEAKLLAGKVCSRIGCSSFAIISGMNWAIEKDVDLINMSLGGPVPSRSQLDAAEQLEAAGVTVIAAAGNDAENVKNKISFPAGYPTVFSVGALTPDLTRASFSQYGPDLDIVAPGTEVISSVPEGTGRESLVQIHFGAETQRVKSSSFVGSEDNAEPIRAAFAYANLGKEEDFADADKFKGKIALIKRGEITFKLKVQNALAAGVKGVVIFNNTTGLVSGSISDGASVGVPVAMIEQHVGEAIVAEMEKNNNVETSVSVERTSYAGFAGTSMASPHVAGVAALMLSANPDLSPAQVRALLRQSATPSTVPTRDNEYGAGLVNAAEASKLAKSTEPSDFILAP